MPKWRVFTWVIIVVNVLFLIWIISGAVSAGKAVQDCSALVGQARTTCEAGNAGTAVGTGIGVFLIVVLWAMVDIILGILWLVTRPKRRPCPVCGTDIKQGVVLCPKCGYDFRSGVSPSPAPPPPATPAPPPPPPS